MIKESRHTRERIGDLKDDFSDRRYGKLGSQARGNIEIAFLRGYQGGYEDCLAHKRPKYYVRFAASKPRKKEESHE